MTRSLRRLREQIVRAKLLAQEASFIAEELNKRTEYLVTLQIPAANLDANRKVTCLFLRATTGRLWLSRLEKKVSWSSFLLIFNAKRVAETTNCLLGLPRVTMETELRVVDVLC